MKIILKLSLLSIILFLSNSYAAIDGAAGHMIEALPKKERGKELYSKYCISCHHENRLGVKNISLLPDDLKIYMDKDLVKIIKDSCYKENILKYNSLTLYELHQIARYIKK